MLVIFEQKFILSQDYEKGEKEDKYNKGEMRKIRMRISIIREK